MLKIGQVNKLKVKKIVDFGVYLEGNDEYPSILLPISSINEDIQINDFLSVFLYYDSDDRIVASTKIAKAHVGGFSFLKVVDVNRIGAFLDWGLSKDLLLPYSEQRKNYQIGDYVLVYVYINKANHKIVATTKYNKYLDLNKPHFKIGSIVNLVVSDITDLGYKVIVNDSYTGLIFSKDKTLNLKIGQTCEGYVKQNRSDGKLDISLDPVGVEKMELATDKLLTLLKENNGLLNLSDKSSPQQINKILKMSKATFKKAIGQLYKRRLITLEDNKIQLRK